MSSPPLPNDYFNHAQAMPNHFKAFTNYIAYQIQKYKDNILIRYPSRCGAEITYKTLTYEETDLIATNLACRWHKYTKGLDTVAFVSSHSASYFIVMLALLKLRITMLCISPRNSEVSFVNLLQKTNCKLIIANEAYINLSGDSAKKLPETNVIQLPDLDFEALSKEPLDSNASILIDTRFSDDDITKPALIIHSSGSTSLPKPIYLSNRYMFILIQNLYFIISSSENLQKVNEKDIMLSCAPLFHIFGFYTTFSVLSLGGSIAFLNKFPSSEDDLLFALDHNKCSIMCAPPFIIDQLVNHVKEHNESSKISVLKYILFGGAPLRNETSEWINQHGVRTLNHYGSTETGGVMCTNTNPTNTSSDALMPMAIDENGDPYCIFEIIDQSQPDIRHLYIRPDCPTLANNVSNRLDGGYDTNDLFRVEHQIPNSYVYLGRRDDTLVMHNGEKTNPIPMENTIRASPIVKQVIVIGRNRQCTAALINLDLDRALSLSPDEMIAAVHEAVKQANKECPGHSVILSRMIKILPFNKLLPSTDKGTVMRNKAELDFKDIIDKLYDDLLTEPNTSQEKDGSTWSHARIKSFLAESAAMVLDRPIATFKDYDTSLFEFGLNSLLSIELRNIISEYFRNIPHNFIFQYSSVNAMYDALISHDNEDTTAQIERGYQQTQALAESYIKRANTDFDIAKNSYDENKPKVVFLTGATGSLGSFILRELLSSPNVKKVYCAVRGDKERKYHRLMKAFESRLINLSLMKGFNRLEALVTDFNDPYLGYGKELYDKLKEEVTIVQHCAWEMEFNLPIEHFDKTCINPFYNILQFAYRDVNPMHVHFVSSISASAASGTDIEEAPLPFDSHVALPMGYAQSKFVVEMLFNYLVTEKHFPCYIQRLGQVCGDSVNGVWNVSEQYPLMFMGGGSVMHKMPDLNINIDWIPIDYAAASIVDIILRTDSLSADKKYNIFHIVNPHTIHWSKLLDVMKSAGMTFETVSLADWTEALSRDESNPAFRLMSFYENSFKQSSQMHIWKTEKTIETTPIIEKAPVIDANLFFRFLNYWGSVGFYDHPAFYHASPKPRLKLVSSKRKAFESESIESRKMRKSIK